MPCGTMPDARCRYPFRTQLTYAGLPVHIVGEHWLAAQGRKSFEFLMPSRFYLLLAIWPHEKLGMKLVSRARKIPKLHICG